MPITLRCRIAVHKCLSIFGKNVRQFWKILYKKHPAVFVVYLFFLMKQIAEISSIIHGDVTCTSKYPNFLVLWFSLCDFSHLHAYSALHSYSELKSTLEVPISVYARQFISRQCVALHALIAVLHAYLSVF